MPAGIDFEWTDLTYQQKLAGDSALFIFPLCVLLAYLILAAQYNSWLLPLAVLLIVPMCLLSAIGGVWLLDRDNNIFTQIGLITLAFQLTASLLQPVVGLFTDRHPLVDVALSRFSLTRRRYAPC